MTDTMKQARREVTLPAATLVELLDAVRAAGGSEALLERGRSAGRALAERLLSPSDGAESPRAMPADLFWKRVGEVFAGRGWGTLAPGAGDLGVGELRSADWIEADRADRSGACDFGAGLLQGVLEHVSAAPLEVREVECRATGAPACRFLFGSAAAVAAAAPAAGSTAPATR